MLVLYGFALNFDVRHVWLAVEDRDLSPASRELIASFVHSEYFDLVATVPPGGEHEALFQRRVAKAILVIPHGYGERLAGGGDAAVQLLLDGADATTATTVLGYAAGLIAAQNARLALASPLARAAASAAIRVEPRVWYNPELRSTHFLVPGLIGFILMLTAVLSTALSVVREKERGTMEQLRVAPLRSLELLAGKTVPYLAISLVATAIILVAARLLFGVVVRGSYLDLFAVTLIYLVGALGLGLFVSTVAESQAVAFQGSMLLSMLPAILLSGFIFPIRNMPEALQLITRVVPARYYLVVVRGVILKGAGLAPYWREVGALALFAAATLALAAIRYARQHT
jgi:ABC-2 type transport system permease protein